MNILKRAISKGKRGISRAERMRHLKGLGLNYVPPNYLYFAKLPEDGVVIDTGCSFEAEFSRHMIEHHGLRAFGVDPTRKHMQALAELEERYDGKFVHLPLAVGSTDGISNFYESKVNESGSLLDDHVNVINDETIEYEIETICLTSLVKRIEAGRVSILKLDLEGMEYELLADATRSDLRQFDQLFVEFHHHAIGKYTPNDTKIIINKMTSFGYQSFSLDDHNYIFYDRK